MAALLMLGGGVPDSVTIPSWLFGALVTVSVVLIPALWRFLSGLVQMRHRLEAIERLDELDSPQSRNRTILRVEKLERKVARIEGDEHWRDDVTPINPFDEEEETTPPSRPPHRRGR